MNTRILATKTINSYPIPEPVPFSSYSYAKTSRMVSRDALRAGRMLAIVDKNSTNPSQIAYPK
jgi:hypothetical protein